MEPSEKMRTIRAKDEADIKSPSPDKLCPRCQLLDLTVDRFLIGTSSRSASASDPFSVSAATERFEAKKAAVKFRIKSGRGLTNFASLRELRAARDDGCPFCTLLAAAMARYSKHKEVDGRQVKTPGVGNSGLVNSTRRIRVRWAESPQLGTAACPISKDGGPSASSPQDQEVSLVFVVPLDPDRPNSDATSRWERETHFLGRELGSSAAAAPREKQALIKSWVDLCLAEHSALCRDTHGTERQFRELVEETYFGVIDVADMQLKSLPMDAATGEPEPFVALSYVWGKRAPGDAEYVTTRRNVTTYIRHGGLETVWSRLPRTIQDTILLVSRLGYRYVWIDALCIVQDSDSSWGLNARAMHLVYGNAVFTICAAEGMDSSAGLPTAGTVGRDTEAGDDAKPMSAECVPGVRLMVTRPLEAVVNDSEWNTRAWTFQERVLSRRCLIFAEGRVYFQCRTTGISQDIYTDGQSSGWSLDRTNSPLRTLRELQQRPMWFYMKYIGLYAGRNLTKPRDVLAAFGGISWLMGRYMQAKSLFGLPTSHFDLALLWSPTKALRVRRPNKDGPQHDKKSCVVDAEGNCACGSGRNDADAFGRNTSPTWSWSGWMDGRIEYQVDMLDGSLLNVSEWLSHHTWIQWYIRNEKGHLRPLWELLHRLPRRPRPLSLSGEDDMEDDGRWQGYPALHGTRHGIGHKVRREVHEVPIRGRERPYEPIPDYYEDESVNVPPREQAEGEAELSMAERHGELVSRYDDYDGTHEPHLTRRHDRRDRDWSEHGSDGTDPELLTGEEPRQRVDRMRRREWDRDRRRLMREGERDAQRRARVVEREVHQKRRSRVVRIEPPENDDEYEYPGNDDDFDRRRARRKPTAVPATHTLASDTTSSTYLRVGNERYTSRGSSMLNSYAAAGTRDASLSTASPAYHDVLPPAPAPTTTSSARHVDNYGRSLRGDTPRADEKMFHSILPDNPFGVIRDTTFGAKDADANHMPVLQFWTWLAELHLCIREDKAAAGINDDASSKNAPELPNGGNSITGSHLTAPKRPDAGAGLCWCDIVDAEGDWCGSIVVDEEWIRPRDGCVFPFIAISDAKSFTVNECPDWTYYIPKERAESEWDLYYVLLLERNLERGLWERVGLGKVFKVAFRKDGWREIKLG